MKRYHTESDRSFLASRVPSAENAFSHVLLPKRKFLDLGMASFHPWPDAPRAALKRRASSRPWHDVTSARIFCFSLLWFSRWSEAAPAKTPKSNFQRQFSLLLFFCEVAFGTNLVAERFNDSPSYIGRSFFVIFMDFFVVPFVDERRPTPTDTLTTSVRTDSYFSLPAYGARGSYGEWTCVLICGPSMNASMNASVGK